MRNEILGDNMRNIVFLDIDGVLNSKEIRLTDKDISKAIKILSDD